MNILNVFKFVRGSTRVKSVTSGPIGVFTSLVVIHLVRMQNVAKN